jgi:hypothetical protein
MSSKNLVTAEDGRRAKRGQACGAVKGKVGPRRLPFRSPAPNPRDRTRVP